MPVLLRDRETVFLADWGKISYYFTNKQLGTQVYQVCLWSKTNFYPRRAKRTVSLSVRRTGITDNCDKIFDLVFCQNLWFWLNFKPKFKNNKILGFMQNFDKKISSYDQLYNQIFVSLILCRLISKNLAPLWLYEKCHMPVIVHFHEENL